MKKGVAKNFTKIQITMEIYTFQGYPNSFKHTYKLLKSVFRLSYDSS